MKLIYVTHQFEGLSDLCLAEHWVAGLPLVYTHVFWAPWIQQCRHWNNFIDQSKRREMFDFEAIAKSDSIVLCGPSESPRMQSEIAEAKRLGKYIHNLVGMSLDEATSGSITHSLAMEFEHQAPWYP